jgi:Fur family ferric uptake transcriptional regulator
MKTAKQILEHAELKSTISRIEVLEVLLKGQNPLTHQEILKSLPVKFDRVTLYRVLDWLLENQLIHKIASSDRSWRFQFNHDYIARSGKNSERSSTFKNKFHEAHAHFQCNSCGKVFCLENVYPKLTNDIPADFHIDSIELNIIGTCISCH